MKVDCARVTNKGLFVKTREGQTAEIPMPKELAKYIALLIIKDQLPRFPLPKKMLPEDTE